MARRENDMSDETIRLSYADLVSLLERIFARNGVS